MSVSTLYVLYNADASVMGKLKYGYRKICNSSEENPACAACDITHGGLSLNETPAWKDAKTQIEKESGRKVVQWHRDELSSDMKEYVKSNSVRFPVVIGTKDGGDFEVIMDSAELATFKGDATKMVDGLRKRGYMTEDRASL